jgi:hypothetical protein
MKTENRNRVVFVAYDGSVKGEDEDAKPCWFIIRARRLHGHEVQHG